MSCALIKAVQIGNYSSGDTYTHIRAGFVDDPGISCDTIADLPAQAGGIPGYYLEQGSTAHVIADNTIYTLNSSGVWMIQDEASRMDVYTKTEIDNKFSDYTTTAAQNLIDGAQDADISNLQTADSVLLAALKWIADTGNVKNLCPTASDTGTANVTINMELPPGKYVVYFGSLTSTDTDNTTCQVVALSGSTVVSASPQLQSARGNDVHGVITLNSACDKIQVYASRTGTASTGDTVSFTNCMICPESLWAISQNFTQYTKTNRELM